MLIMLLLMGSIQDSEVVTEYVDAIEFNEWTPEDGGPLYRQVIFWEYDKFENRYYIKAIRVRQDGMQLLKNPNNGYYEMVWGDGNVIRRVCTKIRKRTKTNYCPAIDDDSDPFDRIGLIGENARIKRNLVPN